MDIAPEVTGVSPCEGYPNTKVKIWGENLGSSSADVISVQICGVECLDSLEWISERKIICTSGSGYGRGRIIVETITGGQGTCSVYFTGLEHSAPQSPRLDPNIVSDIWVQEDWNLFDSFGTGGQTPLSDELPVRKLDPLGIVKKGMAGKMSEENIRQLCPNGSGDLLSDNFNPVMYLLENHCSTTFTQLKDGLADLEREVERSQQAPADFIKNNLDAFIQCFDTLSDVNTLLIRNESETETGSITDKVEVLLDNTTVHADALFQGLIKRKMKADATRNALTVLQRYRFLFNLPRSIERNIKHREYEIVTNDYERAKSLFSGTKVKVFAKVLKEVESLVAKLRSDLKRQLLNNPSTLEEQKKLIKYLLDLDYLGDPAWECIVQMNTWVVGLMRQCKDTYQQPVPEIESDTIRYHDRMLSNLSHCSSDTRMGGSDPSASFSMGGIDMNKPRRILFVERLIEIVSQTLPDLWRLGQAYFSRTLFTMMLSENQDNIISDNTANKGDVFNAMIMEICETFTDMVNAALFEDALEKLPEERVEKLGKWRHFDDNLVDSSGAWLPLCVRRIKVCYSSLQTLHLPDGPLSLFQQLAINVRMLCSDTLFLRTNKDVELLHEREDWQVHEEEGSIITGLPVLFENIVVDVLLTLKEIVIENPFDESEEFRKPLLEGAVESFQGLLEDFTVCLDHLAFGHEKPEGGAVLEPRLSMTGSEDVIHRPSDEERLLLILSNCQYTRLHVTPELFDCFVSHGYPECQDVIKIFESKLDDLEQKVFQAYINQKMKPLVDIVVSGMTAGYYHWSTDVLPTEVRTYVKEALLYLVHVHAEVYSISPECVTKVLSQILEILTAELLEELMKVEEITTEGKLHAFIEVKMFDETLYRYCTDEARENFLKIYKIVENRDKHIMKQFWDTTDVFKEQNKMQFKCFLEPKPSSLV